MIKKRVKKGFTLIELLVVMAISSVLIASLGGGVVNLQSMVKLDNTIRELKLAIQTTQNEARNSFLTYDRNNLGSVTGSFFQGGATTNNVSLGWMITFQNQGTNSISVTRRSVFFKPPISYDFNRLRDEIVNFRNNLISQNQSQRKFECDSGGNFLVGGVNLNNGYTSVAGGTISISCAYKPLYSGSEYFETTITNVTLVKRFGVNALPSCWDPGITGVQQSIFFTSGYGEPALNVDPSFGLNDCQLQVQYAGFLNQDLRALRVSRENGIVELCGSYCTF